jgi:hypothetical protein
MYKKIAIILILIFNSFMITKLFSCEKGEPSSPTPAVDTRFVVPVTADAPSVSSLIARIAELHIALSSEIHAREQLHNSFQQQSAVMARKYTADINSLQARIRALEQR